MISFPNEAILINIISKNGFQNLKKLGGFFFSIFLKKIGQALKFHHKRNIASPLHHGLVNCCLVATLHLHFFASVRWW
jgi:hypothetical protein